MVFYHPWPKSKLFSLDDNMQHDLAPVHLSDLNPHHCPVAQHPPTILDDVWYLKQDTYFCKGDFSPLFPLPSFAIDYLTKACWFISGFLSSFIDLCVYFFSSNTLVTESLKCSLRSGNPISPALFLFVKIVLAIWVWVHVSIQVLKSFVPVLWKVTVVIWKWLHWIYRFPWVEWLLTILIILT